MTQRRCTLESEKTSPPTVYNVLQFVCPDKFPIIYAVLEAPDGRIKWEDTEFVRMLPANLASSPCPCRSGEVASNPPAIAADGAGKEGA